MTFPSLHWRALRDLCLRVSVIYFIRILLLEWIRKYKYEYHKHDKGRLVNNKHIANGKSTSSILRKKQLENARHIHLGKSTASKEIACISDVHVGSIFGIASPRADVKVNPYIDSTYRWWLDCRDAVGKIDALINNGEPINGPSKKSNGWQNWTSDNTEQSDDFEFLIKEWRYAKVFLTRGSGYHIQDGCTSVEEYIARNLNATRYSILTKYLVDDELFLDCNGYMLNVAHHLGFNKWFAYRTTSLAREMADMVFLKNKYYDGELAMITRGHVHYFVRVEFANSIGFTTPCWKFADTHLKKGGLGGTMPNIGMVKLIVETNGTVITEKHIIPDKRIPKQVPVKI
jgi:hypothetical protein